MSNEQRTYKKMHVCVNCGEETLVTVLYGTPAIMYEYKCPACGVSEAKYNEALNARWISTGIEVDRVCVIEDEK